MEKEEPTLQSVYDRICDALLERAAQDDGVSIDVISLFFAMRYGWQPFQPEQILWKDFEAAALKCEPEIMERSRKRLTGMN